MESRKINIAFIKFGGLAAGGSEKLIQVIAAHLPKDRFSVDYFYCDAARYIGEPGYHHIDTDPHRLAYMKRHGVRLIRFRVGAKDITRPTHPWVDTDFWDVFRESAYDLIQTSRAGHKEYPFTHIRTTPIVDLINLRAGVDNQYNIARVLHICQWNADRWVRDGGDKDRIEIFYPPACIEDVPAGDKRADLGLGSAYVYGFHQRPDEGTFSPIPLLAYAEIENEETAFVLLGGAQQYRRQAQELGIKRIIFLPATGDQGEVYRFLKTLDVFAHGRYDGEVNSQAMAEAMYFGLPIVSHDSPINNGHIECIGEAGRVVHTVDEYAQELIKLKQDRSYYQIRARNAKERFKEKYDLKQQIVHIASIYEDVVARPFPNTFRRRLSSLHWTQNIRLVIAWIYLLLKYYVGVDLKKMC